MSLTQELYEKMCREADKFVTNTFKRDEKEPLKSVEKRLERAAHDSEYYFNCGAAATSIVMTANKENSNEDEVTEAAVKALVLFKLKIGM